MNVFSVIILVALFCVLQIVFIKKTSKKWVKYLPTAIGGVGVGSGTAIYYISYIAFLLKINSQSVLSENQYFALSICILFMPCLVGAMLGIVTAKFLGKKQLLYFLPFILSIIIYFGATVMGLGLMSFREIIWVALFLVSGFLLTKEKVWGCVFGMVPGIVFVWMSTVYTGQVINIELPLGLVIIGFFLGCGIGIYRKRYMQKQ